MAPNRRNQRVCCLLFNVVRMNEGDGSEDLRMVRGSGPSSITKTHHRNITFLPYPFIGPNISKNITKFNLSNNKIHIVLTLSL